MSSLPVPLSPVMSTVEGESATLATISWTALHRGRLAHQRRPLALARGGVDVLALQVVRPGRLGDHLLQLLLLERLGDVVEGARLERGHGAVHRAVGGDDDDRHVGEVGADALRSSSMPPMRGMTRSVTTTSTGVLASTASACSPSAGGRDLVALALQHGGEDPPDVHLVVDDEDVGHAGRSLACSGRLQLSGPAAVAALAQARLGAGARRRPRTRACSSGSSGPGAAPPGAPRGGRAGRSRTRRPRRAPSGPRSSPGAPSRSAGRWRARARSPSPWSCRRGRRCTRARPRGCPDRCRGSGSRRRRSGARPRARTTSSSRATRVETVSRPPPGMACERVQRQVQEHLLELLGVGQDPRKPVRQLERDLHRSRGSGSGAA